MGASDWTYKVAYVEDVGAALEALRGEVFAAGQYYPASINPSYAQAMGIEPLADPPASINELIEMQQEEGTHSILDITDGLSDLPDYGTMSPLSDDQLMGAFGTTTPQSSAVAEWMGRGSYSQFRHRWAGVYVVGYEAGEPVDIHFGGYSGD